MKNRKIAVLSLMAAATACVVTAATAMNTKLAYAAGEDVFHELGASVRVAEDKGIRFAFGLPEDKTGDGYAIGTLVIPKALLDNAVLNHNADTADEVMVDYQDIPCTKNFVEGELPGAKDGYKYYNAALTKIPTLNYDTVLVARSYYVKDGVYTYSDPVERSIGYVASAALNDGYEDTKGILTDIVTTGFGEETALTVEGESFATMNAAITLTASNEKGYLPVWSTSDANVATVDKNGNVTVEKSGEVTISATIGNKTASKTVYAMGKGLYADNIGSRIFGNDLTHNQEYLKVATGDDQEMVINAKFVADANYSPAVILRKLSSKAYYEKLIEMGYGYLSFNLTIGVEEDEYLEDLYVFGKTLDKFPKNDNSYVIDIPVQHIVNHYPTINTIATASGENNKVGLESSLSAKLITWKSPAGDWSTIRNYTFTISNAEYKIPTIEMDFEENSADLIEIGETTKLVATTNGNAHDVVWTSSNEAVAMVEDGVVTGLKGGEVTITATVAGVSVSKTVYVVGAGLYENQIGVHAYGWNQTGNADYFNMSVGANNEMTATVKYAGSTTDYPATVLRELYSKTYYEKLLADGYSKLTFTLAVGGDNATNVSTLYVFGKSLTSFAKNADGAYAIVLDLQYMVDNYAKVSGIGTSVRGTNAELNYMLIAWKSTDWSVRNYVFTISNTRFAKGVLFADDFGFRDGGENKTYNGMTIDTGANGEIIIDATFHAADTYGTFLMFNNMNTITYLAGLKGKYASFTFELTVEGGAVNDLHTFGTAKKISDCNKVAGKENTYVVEIRLDMTYFTDSGWKSNMNTFATSTGKAGSWNARSQMLIAWRYNSSSFTNSANHAPREYRFTLANFELRESLLYKYN